MKGYFVAAVLLVAMVMLQVMTTAEAKPRICCTLHPKTGQMNCRGC